MPGKRTISAAGGVIWRRSQSVKSSGGIEVLVIHRPSYDDWTFPKGKADPGECPQRTAVREIEEETGLKVRLGHPLSTVEYRVSSGPKQVHYWMARVTGPSDHGFEPNREVDEIRWVKPRKAATLLSYQHDRDLLEEFRELCDDNAHKTRTLVVLRHAKAESRDGFGGADLERPLAKSGVTRAKALRSFLGAYGVRRVVTSPAVRCASTVEPYADVVGTFLQVDDRLSEDTKPRDVTRAVEGIIDRKKPAVVCSHRPTLPWIFDALGIDPVDLSPGDAVVVHHRKGRVLSTERI